MQNFLIVLLVITDMVLAVVVFRCISVRRSDIRYARDPVAEADWLAGDSDHPPLFDISPAQLDTVRERGDAQLVDVRLPAELKSLPPVPGALSIPLHTLKSNLINMDKEKNIVLICRSGHRGVIAGKTLLKNGYQRVFNLAGGMAAYRAQHANINNAPPDFTANNSPIY